MKHVVGKSRLSMQTHEVFFPQPRDVCAEECMLHCEGKCAEDKARIVRERGDGNVPACLRVAVSRHTVLVL